MIVLFTDFGLTGPYIGQMKAVLAQQAPATPVIDLFADAPVYNPRSNAYLLSAYSEGFSEGTVFLSVVDPGVGSERRPVVVNCDGRWFVGPDNGIFDIVCRRAQQVREFEIMWRPEHLSSSFHGRDLFAPAAAMLSQGQQIELQPRVLDKAREGEWPEELAEIIYIDHFGNLFSGLRASTLAANISLNYQGQLIPRGITFSDVAIGSPFCYENSNGLLEIAINQGRADDYFKAQIGDTLELDSSNG
jgi:S-adenosylmethionine hydrolase